MPQSAPCLSAAAIPCWCMSAAMRRPPTALPKRCCRCTQSGTAALPARSATSSGGRGSRPCISTTRSCCSAPPWSAPPRAAACRSCRRCTISGCSVPTASCCGTAPSARIAPAAACTAHCSTAATAAVWRRPLWSPRPTGCTGRWAAGAASGSRPRPSLTARSCWPSTGCAQPLTKTALLSSQTPSACPPGRSSRGRSATAASSLPAGWRSSRGCAPSSRRGVCWATPRPSCSSPGTARWPTGRAHRRCPGSGFSASLSVRSCTV